MGHFFSLTLDSYQKCMDVNFFGVVNAVQAFYPLMVQQPESQIIVVSSAIALFGLPSFSAYAPTKSALKSYVESSYGRVDKARYPYFDCLSWLYRYTYVPNSSSGITCIRGWGNRKNRVF